MKVNGVAKKVKRGTALLLAGLMMLSSVDISGLEVNAAEESVYEAGTANAQAEKMMRREETFRHPVMIRRLQPTMILHGRAGG